MDKIERKKKKEARKEEYNYVHKIGDICPLSHLKINQVGKVINFNFENKALKRRLLDMGITKGVEIEIVKISPLHDPFNIRLRGYELCIRKDELENIECEVIK